MATSPNFKTDNNFIKYRIVVTENSYDVNTNTSEVNVKVDAWRTNTGYTTYGSGTCYANINGSNQSQSISPSQQITYNSHTVLLNKTVTIEHDQDGSKRIYVSAYIRHSQFKSNSQGFNVDLTNIPRQAVIITAPDFSDQDNPKLVYSNAAGETVESLEACINIDNTTPVVSPTVAYRTLNKLGSDVTFTLTQAERDALALSSPDSATKTVYYIIKTVIAGVTYYTTQAATLTISDANPTISGASYEDTNASTLAITSDSTKIIQNNSTVSFNIGSLAALKSATLSSVKVTIDGVSVTQALSGSTASNVSIPWGVINSTANVTALLEVTDSRGNVSKASLTVTMLEWALPTATISLKRRSNYYDTTDITVSANISSLDNLNQVTLSYQYKETGSSTWSTAASLTDGVTTTITLDNSKSYDFKFIVADLIGTTTYNKALQIGIPILFIDRRKRAVSIGCLPDQNNMLAVDRRIALKTPDQETVLNLWTTNNSDNTYHSARLTILNQSGNEEARLEGNSYVGGLLELRAHGTDESVYITAKGGVHVYNSLNHSVAWISKDSSEHGSLSVSNKQGASRVRAYIGGLGDGVLQLFDSNGSVGVSIAAEDGSIECNHVKSSGSVVEVVDTAFNSGNKTFNNDSYSSITVIAKVTGTSSYNITTIPVMFLESSDKRFCISDELNYVVFKAKLDNGVFTITWESSNGSGSSIEKVYANY